MTNAFLQLQAILPYENPETPDQQDAQNTTALVWFAHKSFAGSLADQIKRHINLCHLPENAEFNQTSKAVY